MSEIKNNNIEVKPIEKNDSFFKNFDMYKFGHIAIEVLVIGGIYWNLNKKIIELQTTNAKMLETIELLKTQNSNNLNEDTLNKINYLSENLDNILQMNANNSKHFQNLYSLIKNLDIQQKMLNNKPIITESIFTKPLDILTGSSPVKNKTKLNAIEIIEEEPTPPEELDAELQDEEYEPEITTTQPPKKK